MTKDAARARALQIRRLWILLGAAICFEGASSLISYFSGYSTRTPSRWSEGDVIAAISSASLTVLAGLLVLLLAVLFLQFRLSSEARRSHTKS